MNDISINGYEILRSLLMISVGSFLTLASIQQAESKSNSDANPYLARRMEQRPTSDRDRHETMSAKQALNRLQEGNTRFVRNKRTNPHQDKARLKEITQGQHPFATVISCSDSRVPVEHLFDAGFGDIFVIRVAGNVCGTDEVGSIEYGVAHVGTPLLVVLGHSDCGAVTAVVEGHEVHGSIPDLVAPIGPAVQSVVAKDPMLNEKGLIPKAIEANVFQSIEDLLNTSPVTRERVKNGQLEIVGGVYHLDSGSVKWLGNHPDQDQLLERTTGPSPTFIHTVFFWLKEGATDQRKQQLIDDCKTYLGAVETVRKIEVGIPAGTPREVVDGSYAVSIVVHFDNRATHDYYQKAEQHLQFIERNKDIWERVQVYDTIVE